MCELKRSLNRLDVRDEFSDEMFMCFGLQRTQK